MVTSNPADGATQPAHPDDSAGTASTVTRRVPLLRMPWEDPAALPARWLTPATAVLIGVNVLVFLVTHDWGEVATRLWPYNEWTLFTLPERFGCNFSTFAPAIASNGNPLNACAPGGQWWRVFSSSVLHANALHLLVNCLLLFLVGPRFETQHAARSSSAVAAGLLVLVYVVSEAGSAAGSLLFNVNRPSIGASGAVYGVIGATLVADLLSRRNLLRIWGVWWPGILMGVLLQDVVLPFIQLGSLNTSYGGHLGGLVTGAVCGLAVGAFTHPRRSPVAAVLNVAAGVAATVAALVLAETWVPPTSG